MTTLAFSQDSVFPFVSLAPLALRKRRIFSMLAIVVAIAFLQFIVVQPAQPAVVVTVIAGITLVVGLITLYYTREMHYEQLRHNRAMERIALGDKADDLGEGARNYESRRDSVDFKIGVNNTSIGNQEVLMMYADIIIHLYNNPPEDASDSQSISLSDYNQAVADKQAAQDKKNALEAENTNLAAERATLDILIDSHTTERNRILTVELPRVRREEADAQRNLDEVRAEISKLNIRYAELRAQLAAHDAIHDELGADHPHS